MSKGQLRTLPTGGNVFILSRPASKEFEKLVIGALAFKGRDLIKRYHGLIQEKWFTDIVYKRMFRVLSEMYAEGLEIEWSIFSERVAETAEWQLIPEGDERLNLAIDDGFQLENIDNYVEKLGEQYRLRSMQNFLQDVWKEVNIDITRIVGGKSVAEIAGNIVTKVREIANEGTVDPGARLGTVAIEREEYRNEVIAKQQRYTGLVINLKEIDESTLGFQKGEGIIIAARPSMGKTAFVIDCIRNNTELYPTNSWYFQTDEMNKQAITDRFLSKKTGIPIIKLRCPIMLNQKQVKDLELAREEFQSHNIIINDKRISTDAMIMNWFRQADSKTGLHAVVLDYLQERAALEEHLHGSDIKRAIRSILARCKAAAETIGIPFFILSQVRREVEERVNKRPTNSDCSEASFIEAHADFLMFVYRDNYYDKSSSNNVAEVIIGKQRNGPTGSKYLAYNELTASFSNLARTQRNLIPTEPVKEQVKRKL